PEGSQAMTGQQVGLDEGIRVEEELETLPCGQFPPRVLALDGLGPASQPGLLLPFAELVDPLANAPLGGRRSFFGGGCRRSPCGCGRHGAVCARGRRTLRRLLGVSLAGLFFLAIFLGLRHGNSRYYPSLSSLVGPWRDVPARRVGGAPYDPGTMDLTPAQLRTTEQLISAGRLPPFDPGLAERLRSHLDARLELGGIAGPGEAIWLGKHRLNDHQQCDGLFESGMLREGPGFEHSPRTAAGALFHLAIELDVATERYLD